MLVSKACLSLHRRKTQNGLVKHVWSYAFVTREVGSLAALGQCPGELRLTKRQDWMA